MKENKKETTGKFAFFLFQYNDKVELSEGNSLSEYLKILQLDSKEKDDSKADFFDSTGLAISDVEHYGKAAGLFWLWKNTNYDFYGFSLANCVPQIDKEKLDNLLYSNKDLIRVKHQISRDTLQENYRSNYFSYDFRMLLSILKKYQPPYYDYSQNSFIDSHYYILPTYIIKKEAFRKFCVWAFPIMEKCREHLADKYSQFQNMYLEHLMYFLMPIYFGYHQKNLKLEDVEKYEDITVIPTNRKDDSAFNLLSTKERLQKFLDDRRVEDAVALYNTKGLDDCPQYKSIFERYDRERRYFKTTIFESGHNLDTLLREEKPVEKTYTKDVLVIEWNSISHKETLLAFEKLGLTYESLVIGDISKLKLEDSIDRINRYLDFYSFKFVFSLNFISGVAEACHSHDTPYIAWSYDSPVSLDPIKYCKYDTSHIFLFDSSETEHFKLLGLDNIMYMPLAVNVEKYDNIICSPEDIDKYSSSISFVGRLYTNKLNDAMAHLSDYKKAYLNALIDTCSATQNYDLLATILTPDFMEFLSQKNFNTIVNAEWDFEKAQDTVPVPGRLKYLLNRTITNRERLLIIGMLSNHWDFKLYSDSSHNVFANTIECGTVNYYTEMPKVFKCSKINLNITLRTISTGIPLRCLDIMGCHGLLLTNHQKDFDVDFEDGINLLFFDSVDEAYDKVKYYLSHESERAKIAQAGYETVRDNYNYPVLMKKVIELSGLGHILKGK